MSTPESVNPFTALKKYAQFSGRSCRKEFWLWFLVSYVISTVSYAIFFPLGLIWGLATIVPNLAIYARRLHDIGKSGWLMLLYLIPIANIILFLIWNCKDSQPGENQYGPNPKGVE